MQLLSRRLSAADEPPGLPQLPVHPGTQVAQVDADRCTTCGTCAEVYASSARGTAGSLNAEHCYGCGLYADACPAKAVTMAARE